jgi:MAPEG family.
MNAMTSLLAFAAWTLAVLSPVLVYRIGLILTGTKANSWTRGQQAVADPGFVTRLTHAHLNCLENLPIFAVLVLVGAAMGKSSVTEPLAQWVFYARVAQSVVHGISTSHPAVLLRAGLFTAQVVLFIIMFVGLFT